MPTENNDYLAFGVWVNEVSGSARADDTGATEVAAFADGGDPAGADGVPAALVGTATYNGSAAGLYTAGDSVDYFHASATLTAEFGTPPDDPEVPDGAPGTVSGMIDNIVAGGNEMSDVITLVTSGNISDGAFSGAARMGEAEVEDFVVTYPFNGRWSGAFYGPAEDDPHTTTVEDSTNTAPKAVAGTFGVTGDRSYVGAFGARRD